MPGLMTIGHTLREMALNSMADIILDVTFYKVSMQYWSKVKKVKHA